MWGSISSITRSCQITHMEWNQEPHPTNSFSQLQSWGCDCRIYWELYFIAQLCLYYLKPDTKPVLLQLVPLNGGQSYNPFFLIFLFFYHRSWIKPKGTWILSTRMLPPSYPEPSDPPSNLHHAQLRTVPVDIVGHGPMKPKEQHHLQIEKMPP